MIWLLDRRWTAWTLAALPKVSADLGGPVPSQVGDRRATRGRQLSITTPVLCRKALIVWEASQRQISRK